MRRALLVSVAAFALSLAWAGTARAQDAGIRISIDVEDFDLEMVMDLVSSDGRGAASDLSALEEIINEPSTGINDVDLDGDGLVDYVGCTEDYPDPRGRPIYGIICQAYPTTGYRSQPVPVAVVTVHRNDDAIEIRGIYQRFYVDNVAGQNLVRTVRYDWSFRNRAFLVWMFDGHRRYVPVYRRQGPYRHRQGSEPFHRPYARRGEDERNRLREAYRERRRRPPLAPIPRELR